MQPTEINSGNRHARYTRSRNVARWKHLPTSLHLFLPPLFSFLLSFFLLLHFPYEFIEFSRELFWRRVIYSPHDIYILGAVFWIFSGRNIHDATWTSWEYRHISPASTGISDSSSFLSNNLLASLTGIYSTGNGVSKSPLTVLNEAWKSNFRRPYPQIPPFRFSTLYACSILIKPHIIPCNAMQNTFSHSTWPMISQHHFLHLRQKNTELPNDGRLWKKHTLH